MTTCKTKSLNFIIDSCEREYPAFVRSIRERFLLSIFSETTGLIFLNPEK